MNKYATFPLKNQNIEKQLNTTLKYKEYFTKVFKFFE